MDETSKAMAVARVEGKSFREIAEMFGLSYSGVYEKLNKADMKVFIEGLHKRLISTALNKAVENITSIINGYQNETDKVKLDHGFKASMKIIEGAGILPGTGSSVLIQQIYQDNRSQIPQAVLDVIQHIQERDSSSGNLLEAEIVEDDKSLSEV